MKNVKYKMIMIIIIFVTMMIITAFERKRYISKGVKKLYPVVFQAHYKHTYWLKLTKPLVLIGRFC